MIVHFHTAIVPNSGELRRMKNIDKDLTSSLGEKSIEVVFFSSSKRNYVKKEGQFKLSDGVSKKYYIPLFPKLGRLTRILFFMYIALRYHPRIVIGERGMYIDNLWPFRVFSPKTNLMVDIHGAVAEELEYQGKSKREVEHGRREERTAVTKVDYVICQSDEMKRYIVSNYSVNHEKICVYRCGIDKKLFKLNDVKRTEIRNKIGAKENEIVFVYSGGLHPWQRVGDSIDLFLRFNKEYPESRLLVLTGDKDGLNKLLADRSFDNSDKTVIATRLPFNEVPDYLNAADVAFLLRHNHVMNAVASPTKLAEYMACGLPVISTNVSSSWLGETGQKYVLNADNCLTNTDIKNMVLESLREEISKFSHKELSLEVDKHCLDEFINKTTLAGL